LKRKAVTLVKVLALIGLVFGLGSFTVASSTGTCPEQSAGMCDHAIIINGTYIWERPLYTELGIASFVFLASAAALALYLRFGSRPHKGTPTSTD
jgi:hypothetical protein